MSEPNIQTQLAVLPPAALARAVEPAQWNALKEIYDGASDEKVALVIDYCKARKLDPLKKPVHIVPVWSARRKAMVETIWPSISETRITAMRTGLFAGQDETAFGPTRKEKIGAIEIEFPDWAQVTVYRLMKAGDFATRVKYVGPKTYFLESYATRKGDDDISPNKMWARRTWGQLEKCAEAAALRRAFPEETGGQATAEEMHGKAIDDEGLTVVSAAATAAGPSSDSAGVGPAAGGEPVKRAAVPRKKGAAAVPVSAPNGPTIEAEVTPVAEKAAASEPTVPPPVQPPPVSPEVAATAEPSTNPEPEPAKAVEPPAPPPAKANAEQAEQQVKPASGPEAPKPSRNTKPNTKPEWPRVVTGYLEEVRDAPVKGNAKYTSVKVARLGGGTTVVNGVEVPLSQLGRVIFDPERPELAKFAVISDQKVEFTIEQQPAASDPTRSNLVIVKALVADSDVLF